MARNLGGRGKVVTWVVVHNLGFPLLCNFLDYLLVLPLDAYNLGCLRRLACLVVKGKIDRNLGPVGWLLDSCMLLVLLGSMVDRLVVGNFDLNWEGHCKWEVNWQGLAAPVDSFHYFESSC